jgi:hypothetical protein
MVGRGLFVVWKRSFYVRAHLGSTLDAAVKLVTTE